MKIEGPNYPQMPPGQSGALGQRRATATPASIEHKAMQITHDKAAGCDVIEISKDGSVVEQIPSEEQIAFRTSFRAVLGAMLHRDI